MLIQNRKNIIKMVPILFIFLGFFALWLSSLIFASVVSYDFDSDTLGQTPVNTIVTDGTFQVVDQAILGNSLRATTLVTGNTPGLLFNNFSSSTDQVVTWKQASEGVGGRNGFVLRAQSEESNLSGSSGLRQGYLFQVNSRLDSVRIYVLDSSTGATQLMSTDLASSSPRWFKAMVIGNELGFYYSDNGVNFTLIAASSTNSVYSSGIVQYTAGYGVSIGNDYVDDIVYDTLSALDVTAPDISSVASTTDSTSATITWTTNEASDSQINYGITSLYGSTTTLNTSLVTSHSVNITGLDSETLYHFRVRSADSSNNLGISGDYTFTTTAVASSTSITNPVPYQVIQRGSDNNGDITITGTYTGSPSAIEASWNGGTYETIDSSPSGGNFSGVLSNQVAGQGTLIVRFVNDTSVSTSTSYVGVGDIFVIAGQSNASGRGTSNQSYSHATIKASLFGNDDNWKELSDPTDSSTNQVDSVSSDGATGSVWPLVATLYLSNQGVPVAFIPTAKGGSSITQWQRNTSASTLYGSMYRRINAVGGLIKAVLFFQGETDAQNGLSQSDYSSNLENFSNAVYSDFGVKTIVGQIGNNGYTASNTDAVRLAQLESWNTGTTTLPGPATPDVSLSDEGGDNLHFKSNGDLQTWANRWWASINKNFFNGLDGRGPIFVSAEENIDRTTITITFSDDSLPLIPSTGFTGFTVKDGGVLVGTISTTTMGSNTVRIGLENPLSGSGTISFGSGGSVAGATVLTDSSIYNLPVEIFINESVSSATPPVVTDNSSSSTLSSGTTEATLSVLTDQNAQCRYSTDEGVAFSSMSDIFNSTGTTTPTTSHTTTINGLSDGNNYTYYVKCEDSVGNATSTDLALSFSVASPSSNISSSSNASGGGQAAPLPMVPVNGFTAIPSTERDNKEQTITFNFGSDVTRIVISDNVDFSPALYIKATSTIEWPEFYNDSLYVKFCNKHAKCSDVINLTKSNTLNQSKVSSFNFDQDISIGDVGEDVLSLQNFLISQGYIIPAGATGYFGLQTQTALAKYQKNNDINPSAGYLGPVTRKHINLSKSLSPVDSLSNTISAKFSTSLYLGLQSTDVTRLQTLLATKPEIYPEGLVTGYFGLFTEKAVQTFQINYGVLVSSSDPGFGYVGPKTRSRLLEVFGN